MTNTPVPNKLELHYFFSDDSHSMNALVRNKCEQELLAIIQEVSLITGIDIRIETEAYSEGGLRERFRLMAKNQFVLAALLTIITGVATVHGNIITHLLTMDQEKEKIEKQKLRNEVEQGTLNIENARIEIDRSHLESQQLRKNMRRHERDVNEANRVSPAVDVSRFVSFINDTSYKVIRHKSNFYRTLHSYPKVTQVSFARLSANNEETSTPATVPSQKFTQFIVSSDELKPVRDEEAVLEIISPVLKPGSYKWKGIYLKTGQPIDFYMKDQDFKDDVVRSRLPFRNGSRISCVLVISRRLTETGEVVNISYSVSTVTAIFEGEAMVETSQGRDYRLSKNQLQLAFE